MKFLRKINLEINKDLYNPIQVKQNDTARYLLFNLLDNGVPFSLENKTVRVYGVKPDGTKVFNNLTIINAAKGLAELQLTTQMLVKPGCLKLELVIYEATDILSTTKFDIDIISCIRDDRAIESTNEFSALTLGLSKLDEWDKYFKETSGKIEEKYTERLSGLATSLEETKIQVSNKVEKVEGETLTPNKYTDNDKNKVETIPNLAPKTYVDTKVATLSSGTPLFANSINEMTDVTKNYCNLSDGFIYTHNGESFVKSTVKYQELGLSDGQVTPIKTNFITFNKSVNLFDKTKAIDGVYTGKAGEKISINSNIENFKGYKFEVKPNTTYICTGTTYNYFLLDSNEIILAKQGDASTSVDNVKFTTGEITKYVCLSFRQDRYPVSSYMIVEGNSLPSSYEPFVEEYRMNDEIEMSLRTKEYIDSKIDITKSKTYYVSNVGNDNNDGLTENTPLKTFQKAIDLGASKIIATAGTYKNQTLICENRDLFELIVKSNTGNPKSKVVIDNSTNVNGLTLDGNVYSIALSLPNDNWKKVFIDKTLTPIRDKNPSGIDTYNINLWEVANDNSIKNDKRLVPVLSKALCSSTEGSFCWDGTKLYIHPTGGNITNKSYKYLTNETGDGIYINNVNRVFLENVDCLFVKNANFKVTNCNDVKILGCDAGYNAYSSQMIVNYSNTCHEKCRCYKASSDGFSGSGNGHSTYVNCEGFYCYDDGMSHHDGCTGTVVGGEYYGNVKGGISPAHGTAFEIHNTLSYDNGYGYYCEASASSQIGRTIRIFGSSAQNNKYGISINRCIVKAFNCKFENNTTQNTYIRNPEEGSKLIII